MKLTCCDPSEVLLDLQSIMKGVFLDPAPHPPLRLLPIHCMPVVMLLAVPFSHSPNVFAVVVGANQKD